MPFRGRDQEFLLYPGNGLHETLTIRGQSIPGSSGSWGKVRGAAFGWAFRAPAAIWEIPQFMFLNCSNLFL